MEGLRAAKGVKTTDRQLGAFLRSAGTAPNSVPVTTLKTTHHRGSICPQGKHSRSSGYISLYWAHRENSNLEFSV